MATASDDPTLVGTFASQHDAEAAEQRLETQGIEPITVEDVGDGTWKVHAPAARKQEALEQLQILEQRRRGPAV